MLLHSGFFGADDEARTRYLHLGKVALYQMSYIRISWEQGILYTNKNGMSRVFFKYIIKYLHSYFFYDILFAWIMNIKVIM